MSNSGHPKDHGHRRGLMLVLSSPSGAGKTTLAKKLIEEFYSYTKLPNFGVSGVIPSFLVKIEHI